MSMRTLRSRLHSILVTGAVVLGASIVTSGAAATTALASSAAPDFGSNVLIFNPSMSQAAIQSAVDAFLTLRRENSLRVDNV